MASTNIFGDSLNGVGGSKKRHNQPKTEYCERPFTEYYNLVKRCMIIGNCCWLESDGFWSLVVG